jgi:uncharacterized protein YjiS (DUF1127 family)
MIKKLVRMYRRWQALSEIYGLDDRTLKDIGFTRAEMELRVRQSYR